VGLAMLAAVAPAQAKEFRIALSNSYIGNEWRVEMVNFMQAYAEKSLKGKVKFTVNNSGTDPQAQIAAISDMISDKVDAILVNPASETALNPILEEAVKRGIVVIDFDQRVSAPSAYKVCVDFVEVSEIHAKWLMETLGGKGKIIVNRGVPGFQGDKALYQGVRNIVDKYPNVHIVDEVYGKWDNAVTQEELTKALTAHPDADGILNQYGSYGAVEALINLKHPFIPMSGQSENGWRLAMLKYKDQGLKGVSAGDPAVVGAYALKIAVDVLEGHGPKDKDVRVPVPIVTTEELKAGVNVFPDLPPTLDDGFDIPGANLGLTIQDGVKAK
jgi:ribose transport system substrate-binding protein